MRGAGSGVGAIEIGLEEKVFATETLESKKVNGARDAGSSVVGFDEGDRRSCRGGTESSMVFSSRGARNMPPKQKRCGEISGGSWRPLDAKRMRLMNVGRKKAVARRL